MKPANLKRYSRLAILLMRHGRGIIATASGLNRAMGSEDIKTTDIGSDPQALARDLEKLGPTYIKLGQMFSTRPDILPTAHIEALSRLQDDVDPLPWEVIQGLVEKELKISLSKAFLSFDRVPLASASLGQVHRAVTRDGIEVAVKVQRPGIPEQIASDLDAFTEVAEFLDKHTETGKLYGFTELLSEFRESLGKELDYQQEARHLRMLAYNMRDHEHILVPLPHDSYSSARVLTMDYVRGKKITDLSPLVRLQINGRALAESLLRAYLDQILVDGFFHADPHPGNVLLMGSEADENSVHKLALIDLGMVGTVDPKIQAALLRMMFALYDGNGHEAADISMEISTPMPDFKPDQLRRDVSRMVARVRNLSMGEMQLGRMMIEMTRISARCRVRPAPELSLLGKTMLNLDRITSCLDPEYNPMNVIRKHGGAIVARQMLQSFKPETIAPVLLESQELARTLPTRLNRVTRALAQNSFTLQIKTNFDEDRVLGQLDRETNRISMSMVLSALIIGAALIMRVETDFTLLGYPCVAIILFLMAVVLGFFLVMSMLFGKRGKK